MPRWEPRRREIDAPPDQFPKAYDSRTSELYNPAELGTALLFFGVGLVMLRLTLRTRRSLPRLCLVFYALFAAGGFLVAGEEISWGQHFFGFETSEFFQEHNKQEEMNLHNLGGDLPSKILRRIAEIGFPILLIVVPALHLWLDKRAYTPGHWPYYVLPRYEAFVATFLGAIYRPFDRSEWGATRQIDELAEMLWALAIFFWAIALMRRLVPAGSVDQELEANHSPD